MADHQLGRTGEAAAELKLGRDAIEARFGDGLERGDGELGFWFDWVFARIMLQEALALNASPVPLAGHP